jgi:hypothetical protein
LFQGFGLAQAARLNDRHAQASSGSLDCRLRHPPAAAGGSVGLCDHAGQGMPARQGHEAGDGKLGRSHENDASHGGAF